MLINTPVKNFFKTISLIILAMGVAFVIWYLSMKLLAKGLEKIPTLKDPEYKLPRLWINIFVYSVMVIWFNGHFKKAAGKIVAAENKKYKKEFEESLINKNYTLGFFNSYLGMTSAAFYD